MSARKQNVKSWLRSHWVQPDGSTCQEYLVIAIASLVFAALFTMMRTNVVLIAETLVLGLIVASLIKNALWRERKLLVARDVLLQVAFRKCHCDPNAIVIADPVEPEPVGKPVEVKGYCEVCNARAVLKEEFPGAIQQRVRELTLQRLPVPEDLISYLTPSQRIILQDELSSGWKIPFGPDWGERQ